MASTCRSPATLDAILEAAIEEFIEHGLAGLRMEHVAKRSGYNKALVYRWFKSKDRLLRVALERRFSQRAGLLDKLPESLSEILAWWSHQTIRDPNFMRMILREALDAGDVEPAHVAFRRAYYRRQIALLKRLQLDGRIAREFDSDMLFVALLSVVTMASALPQIVELATGLHPAEARFKKRWSVFLETLAAHLAEDGRAKCQNRRTGHVERSRKVPPSRTTGRR